MPVRHGFVHGRSRRTTRYWGTPAEDGCTIHHWDGAGLAPAVFPEPSALPVSRDAQPTCRSRVSLIDEAERQSGDICIDELVRSYRRQADLHLHAPKECDVVSSSAVREEDTHSAPIYQSDDALDQRNVVCGKVSEVSLGGFRWSLLVQYRSDTARRRRSFSLSNSFKGSN